MLIVWFEEYVISNSTFPQNFAQSSVSFVVAVIGENRYEWEIAYLSIVCGTGIVVPLDKSLPENEIESLIKRSDAEAIFYSTKYDDIMKMQNGPI